HPHENDSWLQLLKLRRVRNCFLAFQTVLNMTTTFDPYSPVYQRVIDGVIAAFAFWLAYQAFFSGVVPAAAEMQLWQMLFIVAAGRVAANELLGCYRTVWRYLGLHDLLALGCSCALFSLTLFLARFMVATPLLKIPAGIVLLELLISSSAASGARAARRLLYE